MKTLVFVIIVIALCINCNRDNSPSIYESVQETNRKDTLPSRNTMAAQKQNEKNMMGISNGNALRVYIDPETGEFITPPEDEVPPDERAAPPYIYNTSHEGLEEKASPVPGGGTMIDLKGRFRSPLSAKVERNGKISIGHETIGDKE